ncbi:MAG TPA: hypothetical protein VGI86_04705 [Acidimicrobiia bacterium]
MDDLTAADWSVLHELRLRGLLDEPALAGHAHLVELEFVRVRAGRIALTDTGRAAHARWALVATTDAGYDTLVRFHRSFAALNRELLSVCSAWQVLPSSAPNDHRDARYDWEVIARLERLHERAAPAVRRVARHVERFGSHERRLRHALRQVVDEGANDWFTSPRIDSYHTVWNQLHEDVLLALGRSRGDEPEP